VTEPIPVGRLFETHLTTSDLGRSVAFYRDVIGLPVAFEAPERGAAFFWVGGPGEGMLGLWSLGSAPLALALHAAFRTELEEVLEACARLRSLGVTPLSFFATETDEPSVIGWMPAAAVYCRDPDGHLLEYLAMLDAPPDPGAGIVSWSQWIGGNGDRDPARVRIEHHKGPRSKLRSLFAMAEDSASRLDTYLDAGEVLVAVVDDRVVGHLQLIDAEIKNMAVQPSYRGRGIGRRLVEAAVELVRARDRSTLAVATAAADVDNLRFYQRAGFRLRSVERDAFTPATGYAPQSSPAGIELRDRVWLDLDLGDVRRQERAAGSSSSSRFRK
jgi:lactoylglutathione lyase